MKKMSLMLIALLGTSFYGRGSEDDAKKTLDDAKKTWICVSTLSGNKAYFEFNLNKGHEAFSAEVSKKVGYCDSRIILHGKQITPGNYAELVNQGKKSYLTTIHALQGEKEKNKSNLERAQRDAAQDLVASIQGGGASAAAVEEGQAEKVLNNLRFKMLNGKTLSMDVNLPSLSFEAFSNQVAQAAGCNNTGVVIQLDGQSITEENFDWYKANFQAYNASVARAAKAKPVQEQGGGASVAPFEGDRQVNFKSLTNSGSKYGNLNISPGEDLKSLLQKIGQSSLVQGHEGDEFYLVQTILGTGASRLTEQNFPLWIKHNLNKEHFAATIIFIKNILQKNLPAAEPKPVQEQGGGASAAQVEKVETKQNLSPKPAESKKSQQSWSGWLYNFLSKK